MNTLPFPKRPSKPDVMVVDVYCDECGHHPGAWMFDDVRTPLPVAEESAYVRYVSEWATHPGCGGRVVIATEPLVAAPRSR